MWKGKTEEALLQLRAIHKEPLEEKASERLDDFYHYIANNAAYVVNYNERHHAHLPYTTHVAESTIEHVLNARCRKKQKMQWSRIGADNVLQLRVTMANQQWPSVWNIFIKNHYKLAA